VAVLLVAAAGAGRWAGLDFYVRRLRRRVGQTVPPALVTVETN